MTSTENSFPAGGFNPACTWPRKTLVASAVRAAASAFAFSLAMERRASQAGNQAEGI
ncbi:hypothetical protein MKK67_11175 [Methylobacterium sp. J-072]|uniref:hypothetical protein n=1 Tax=Methylobacterium sp. J-072 TaxID=2836651 RepID=UPI001FBBEFEC|nr:hypothetical protein [Methylobacterium sp. J-072]MCJ2093056.1 hypothetical protein [Methylobacterium sp. J-072]